MSASLDPRELKILGDILALVLEEHPGSSSNALEALRKRAQRNAVTGGAIKNLFTAIAPNPPPPGAAQRSRARSKPADPSAASAATAARSEIATLTNDLRRLDQDLRRSRALTAELRAELEQTRMARAALQTQISTMLARNPARTSLIVVALVAGALVGIATTQFVHTLHAPHRPDILSELHS